MTHRDCARAHHVFHAGGKTEETEGVRHGCPLRSHTLRDFVLRELEIIDEHAIRFGFLDRIEFLTLEVLDQRQLEQTLVGYIPDDRRDLVDSRSLSRPPSPFPSD